MRDPLDDAWCACFFVISNKFHLSSASLFLCSYVSLRHGKKHEKQRVHEIKKKKKKKKRDTIIPAALILMKCKHNSLVKEAVIAQTVL